MSSEQNEFQPKIAIHASTSTRPRVIDAEAQWDDLSDHAAYIMPYKKDKRKILTWDIMPKREDSLETNEQYKKRLERIALKIIEQATLANNGLDIIALQSTPINDAQRNNFVEKLSPILTQNRWSYKLAEGQLILYRTAAFTQVADSG